MLDKTVEERILAAMNFEEGDRVPIWDYIDNRNIVDYLAPGVEDYDAAMVKVYHELGIDLCRGYGVSYKKEDNGQLWTNEQGDVARKISGETNWKVKHEIETVEELKNFNCPAPPGEDEKARWIAELKAKQELFAPYTMIVPAGGCGFHAAYDLMGLEFFSLAIYDYRDEIERIIIEFNGQWVEFAKAAAAERLCPLFFIGDDIAYKGRLMFSPNFLRETFIPALRNCCEPLNNAGIKVIYHSDGYVMEILDDMIEAGISGLNPIEPAAGMDIGFLKKRYGRNLILVGNVDCSQVLPLGSVDDVIAATKECLRQASKGGGHFIGSSSEIVPATPVENIIAFYQMAREFGKYPINIIKQEQ
jgi:uroporphyrinogen decarboxylase